MRVVTVGADEAKRRLTQTRASPVKSTDGTAGTGWPRARHGGEYGKIICPLVYIGKDVFHLSHLTRYLYVSGQNYLSWK